MPLTQPNYTPPFSGAVRPSREPLSPPNPAYVAQRNAQEKRLQVIRGLRRKLSYVPQTVIDHFASQGKVVTLNSSLPDAVALYSGYYRYPVSASDLNEPLVADLKQAGFVVGQDGTLKRGDCLLYWIDEARREDLRDEAEIVWYEQGLRPSEESVERLNELFQRSTGGAAGVVADPRSSRTIDQHVHHRGR